MKASDVDPKVVDRIRKLWALARGSDGSESKLAKKMARRLMDKHRIEATDLRDEPEPQTPVVPSLTVYTDRQPSYWRQAILEAMASRSRRFDPEAMFSTTGGWSLRAFSEDVPLLDRACALFGWICREVRSVQVATEIVKPFDTDGHRYAFMVGAGLQLVELHVAPASRGFDGGKTTRPGPPTAAEVHVRPVPDDALVHTRPRIRLNPEAPPPQRGPAPPPWVKNPSPVHMTLGSRAAKRHSGRTPYTRGRMPPRILFARVEALDVGSSITDTLIAADLHTVGRVMRMRRTELASIAGDDEAATIEVALVREGLTLEAEIEPEPPEDARPPPDD